MEKSYEVEIASIKGNHTWKLVELPTGATVIGFRRILKTKLNEKGEVESLRRNWLPRPKRRNILP